MSVYEQCRADCEYIINRSGFRCQGSNRKPIAYVRTSLVCVVLPSPSRWDHRVRAMRFRCNHEVRCSCRMSDVERGRDLCVRIRSHRGYVRISNETCRFLPRGENPLSVGAKTGYARPIKHRRKKNEQKMVF